MQRFTWTNDLHFDRMQDRDREEFVQWVRGSGTDALVIAGDIGEADCVETYLRQMHESLAQPIYFVLGNHDFYHGEFDAVRSAVRELAKSYPRLHWLSEQGVIHVNEATALIGHEGWGDGRWGDYEHSRIYPNDFRWIKDLTGLSKEPRLLKLNAEGVPYKSSPAALTDVIGGQVQFLVVDLASARPHLQSGKLRALAVTTSKRSGLAPDLPTIEETLGLRDFDLAAWTGLFGPAGMPRDVTEKLSAVLLQVLAKSEVRDRIQAAGAEPTPSDSATFTALVKRQLEVWGRKVSDAGIQPE